MYESRPVRCECCGQPAASVVYGEADSTGHVWTHYVCAQCHARCTSDEEGRPLHEREAS